MASSTPPPHCTLTTSKPYQNHHHNHPHLRPSPSSHPPSSIPRPPQSHRSVSFNRSHVPPPPPAAALSSNPQLAADFSGRRSTRFVSKMHFGRPRTSSASSRHSSAAEDALQQAVRFSGDDSRVDAILLSLQASLSVPDDYAFLLRELGNRGEWSMALRCYEFAVRRLSRRRNEQGKLASTMISTLGRLGKVDLAKGVFDKAVFEGYGSTVYTYSALISAYAKSGYCDDAFRVFATMKDSNLTPNLVTYNALIDACGKGGADFKRASDIFDEMLRNGVHPDRISYNSLLAVCAGAGLWEKAKSLFDEMLRKGIDQDIYTYNTLLDAACNGGHMDAAFDIMAEMSAKHIMPNQISYSTVIRGCHKAGKLDKALNLFHEMKFTGMKLDRVSYNNLLGIYASLGRFEEALTLAQEMESMGINKDVVTYNALIDGFGKQARYDKVKELFAKMKAEGLSPNLLTYSTLISVYSKGGLYKDAMQVYKEFKKHGMKADVVFYSNLIDALCKKGFVESSALLLDEMMEGGIQPNVVTYNSIINAFGWSVGPTDYPLDVGEQPIRPVVSVQDVKVSKPVVKGDDRIIKIFEQLASDEPALREEIKRGQKQDFQCVLKVFQKMHEMEIKPNVVTFSAILNACSRCSSFQEASLLLEELRLFDNHVYGVAHGLLMGNDEKVWRQALSLFDEVKRMDSSTASAFYNALTDMLWHFGQRRGAQLVVLEGKRRQVWESTCTYSCLDLHLMSSGAARAMVHAWLLDIRSFVSEGHELPELVSILTGWGKHSKVVGDGALKRAVEALLTSMGAPFWVAKRNIGRFISTGAGVSSWLKESGTLQVLVLKDDRTYPESSDAVLSDLQPLPL